MFPDAAFPPRLDEPETVAHQLDEGSRYAEQSHFQALVLDAGVDEDDEAVEE